MLKLIFQRLILVIYLHMDARNIGQSAGSCPHVKSNIWSHHHYHHQQQPVPPFTTAALFYPAQSVLKYVRTWCVRGRLQHPVGRDVATEGADVLARHVAEHIRVDGRGHHAQGAQRGSARVLLKSTQASEIFNWDFCSSFLLVCLGFF